jgi:hypothetical protein
LVEEWINELMPVHLWRELLNLWNTGMVVKNLEFGTWNLFVICYLRFVISSLSGLEIEFNH